MIKNLIKNALRERGYIHVNTNERFHDIDKEFFEIYEQCKEFTLTSLERMHALYMSIRYLAVNNIPGDLVECGVWKGGSVKLMAMTLSRLNDTSRKIYLYDTYEGMSKPTDKDVNYSDISAHDKWDEKQRDDGKSDWCYSPIDEVKNNISATGYPEKNFIFVQGMVEDTIPGTMPEKIALLRLDTDFYESTYHELKHLYPALVSRGILIIDDYGHWRGSKEATDQYIMENRLPIFLNRVDYAGRVAIKC